MNKIMLTVAECSRDIFGGCYSEDSLYRLIREGKMPVVRMGRKIFIHRPTIEKWIEGGGCG